MTSRANKLAVRTGKRRIGAALNALGMAMHRLEESGRAWRPLVAAACELFGVHFAEYRKGRSVELDAQPHVLACLAQLVAIVGARRAVELFTPTAAMQLFVAGPCPAMPELLARGESIDDWATSECANAAWHASEVGQPVALAFGAWLTSKGRVRVAADGSQRSLAHWSALRCESPMPQALRASIMVSPSAFRTGGKVLAHEFRAMMAALCPDELPGARGNESALALHLQTFGQLVAMNASNPKLGNVLAAAVMRQGKNWTAQKAATLAVEMSAAQFAYPHAFIDLAASLDSYSIDALSRVAKAREAVAAFQAPTLGGEVRMNTILDALDDLADARRRNALAPIPFDSDELEAQAVKDLRTWAAKLAEAVEPWPAGELEAGQPQKVKRSPDSVRTCVNDGKHAVSCPNKCALHWDVMAAQVIAKTGNAGKSLAKLLVDASCAEMARQVAGSAQVDYVEPTPADMWRQWWTVSPAAGRRGQSVVMRCLANAVIADVTLPRMEAERAASGRAATPTLPLALAKSTTAALSATGMSRGRRGPQLVTHRGPVAFSSLPSMSGGQSVALVSGAAAKKLMASANKVLTSVDARKLWRMLLLEVTRKHFAGEDNPLRLTFVGGWSTVARMAGIPAKRRGVAKKIATLLRVLDFKHRGWSGSLVTAQHYGAGPGVQSRVVLTMGDPCHPTWLSHKANRLDDCRRFMPILGEPSGLSGRQNDRAAQWSFLQHIGNYMAEHPKEMTGGFVKLTPLALRGLASDCGLPWKSAQRALAQWSKPTDKPPVLVRDGDLWALGDFYETERNIITQGHLKAVQGAAKRGKLAKAKR